jgi:hypothetical protein
MQAHHHSHPSLSYVTLEVSLKFIDSPVQLSDVHIVTFHRKLIHFSFRYSIFLFQ